MSYVGKHRWYCGGSSRLNDGTIECARTTTGLSHKDGCTTDSEPMPERPGRHRTAHISCQTDNCIRHADSTGLCPYHLKHPNEIETPY